MKHNNLKGVDYIEKTALNVLRRSMSVADANVGEDKLYSSSATLPTCRPDASGRPKFTFRS
jgi:hypothetical protein